MSKRTRAAALGAVAASNTTSLASLGATMLVMLRSLSYGQAVQGAYINVSGAIPAIEELQQQVGEPREAEVRVGVHGPSVGAQWQLGHDAAVLAAQLAHHLAPLGAAHRDPVLEDQDGAFSARVLVFDRPCRKLELRHAAPPLDRSL